jgi:hypothetical protein
MVWGSGYVTDIGIVVGFVRGSFYRGKMIMRVATSEAGCSFLLASAHLWNASPSVLSQVPLQRDHGPFYQTSRELSSY